MKSYLPLSLLIVALFSAFSAQAAGQQMWIKGTQAKLLYNSLTGPKVQEDGTAGHLYRIGTSILCRYTNADITKKGKKVPPYAPCRYACTIKFDHNGLASPGQNP
ncbi:Uncharacterised protein [Legionella lansingensis]|uniref:Uncharacterized protein n=1 Tax=Legionella lansingensis TaxID=45067 RepID=A0A0W0VLB1_9GAMM|nr:hypothetical protein [Legionella lansingensis]KTD20871.1 hypothetical protein Llan_1601 [Legionella lansingensis]SNV43595.1 Uncharacterised protein [Legionella lansingensis]